jgi:pimeloyl-ACP methyl ester carboxylesterase
LPGAAELVSWLLSSGQRFLFLTNYPSQTPADLASRNKAGRQFLTLDEGDAPLRPWLYKAGPTTVVCLHGNPTWSYLWSRVLRELDPMYRVIAPDHLGMGWSDHVGPRPYRQRVDDVIDLLAALSITEPVWLVAQDWGGAIAMGVAVRRPDLVAGLVLSNTGIAVPTGRSAPWLIRLAATNGVHRLATRTTPAFVRGTPWLPGKHVTRQQRRALAAPYRGSERRDAIAGFVADVPFDDPIANSSRFDLPSITQPSRNICVDTVDS